MDSGAVAALARVERVLSSGKEKPKEKLDKDKERDVAGKEKVR